MQYPQTEPLIGVPELANHLQLTDETVRRLARSNTIPSIKVGRAVRFRLSEVISRLENRV